MLLSIVPTRIAGRRGCFLLGADITGQKGMQEALARSERALRRQATILDERNAALKVLLEQREQDHRELEERIVSNLDQIIEPTLERLSRALRHRPERLDIDALRGNLREIVGPFGQRLAQRPTSEQPLTRREKEVAALVRQGRTSARDRRGPAREPGGGRLPPRQHPAQARRPQGRAAARDAPGRALARLRRRSPARRPTGSRAARPRRRRARRAPARPSGPCGPARPW